MFGRIPKSPRIGPTLDLFPCAGLGDSSGLRTERLQEWRHAAERVGRAYKVWCSASSCDRHDLYLSFLGALEREEEAARALELDAGARGTSKGDRS